MRTKWLALVAVLSGCPDVTIDKNVTGGPVVEFDPSNSIIPFPNNLIVDPTTHKVAAPAGACESATAAAIRTGLLNQLDGFGTFETPIVMTLTTAADPATLANNVFLFQRLPTPSTTPIPVKVITSKSVRFAPGQCFSPQIIDNITVIPTVPLESRGTYTVAVLDGLTTSGGTPYLPSFTWGLVRQSEDPVTTSPGCDLNHIDGCTILQNHTPIPMPASTDTTDPNLQQLVGVHTLWLAHSAALSFLDTTGKLSANRGNLLVATDFTTQTTTAPLDPTVAGSPASTLSNVPLLGTFSVATAKGAPCNAGQGCTAFMNAALGAGTCTVLPCNKVGDVLGAGLTTVPYQVLGPNSFAPSQMIPGTWTDPVAPTAQAGVVLQALAFIPNGTAPTNGWPTIIFGHGLGSSKESLFAIAAQFASAGFASVAIDFQAHGSRAVPITADPALGCAGVCQGGSTACDTVTPCAGGAACINGASTAISPTTTQQCYAPFLSTNLGATRDNIRQTVLDLQRLTRAAKACGTTACASSNNSSVFAVDGNHLEYAGISLGGIIGTTTVATSGLLKGGVLNVPGVGLIDVLENTQTNEIKCPLVNALIDLGFIVGDKWDPSNPTVGLCTTDNWKTQPGYLQFSQIARWVLDSADGANFMQLLKTRRFLIQEVVGDQVVPNYATDDEGMLAGLTPGTADLYVPPNNTSPSAAIAANPLQNLWVRYPTLPADSGTGFPGNTFEHASLLRPAATTPASAGQLGTARLQTDAITFLFANQ